MNVKNLFVTIRDTVLEINQDLKLTNNTGIFFAPELYISFCIGKNILKNCQNIFDTTNVDWKGKRV